ncbi:hypothetical protein [Sulfoacidibacillus thermotolerans]|uniref:Uncharacterized protein n=1 Tax=Sulfoacidibacillus thermotolerans TaxID=1765684 RepID=A0A2U3D6G0_SULT2|nr:hypothetical protein [Sulfoacidibacillus thermotolerans]PWI56868.1 hypothetical protein BM613_11575 [Sulfoacidibacillus thermotolerans]
MVAVLNYIFPGLIALLMTAPLVPHLWRKREFRSLALLVLFACAIIAGAVGTWLEFVFGAFV